VGQKTHPKAFRLGITENHISNWYARKLRYATMLRADGLIRQIINEIFTDTITLSNIEIFRGGSENSANSIGTIVIKALHPSAREVSKKVINTLLASEIKNKVSNFLHKKIATSNNSSSQKIRKLLSHFIKIKAREAVRKISLKLKQYFMIRFEFIKNPYEDSNLIAKIVGEQIKKRAPFRRVLRQSIKKASLAGLKGLKIELSGRLNGIDIARSEWKRHGKIPLHTLSAKIDYTSHFVSTVYGIIGIKVWVYRN